MTAAERQRRHRKNLRKATRGQVYEYMFWLTTAEVRAAPAWRFGPE
jgi:hypothetical protein